MCHSIASAVRCAAKEWQPPSDAVCIIRYMIVSTTQIEPIPEGQ
jgi:hypothetical protein